MAWAKFHDGFDDDPDIDHLSGDAIALFVCSITWSSRSLTDGFVPESRARKLPGGTRKAIAMLCLGEKPWWVKVDGGYYIRNFLKYNFSAEEIRANRDETFSIRSEAGKKGMQSRWQNKQAADNKPLNSDNKPYNKTPFRYNKNITPGPVSRVPFPEPHNPKNRNSTEFQREPVLDKDYVLLCIGDEAAAKMFKPGTEELFDAAQWFAERNLEPTRRWEDQAAR